MGFSRQDYWSGLPFPSPGDLPNSRIEPGSPTFQADALTSEPPHNWTHFITIKAQFVKKLYFAFLYLTLCLLKILINSD